MFPSATTLLLGQTPPFSVLWGHGHYDFFHSRAAVGAESSSSVLPAQASGPPPPLFGLGCRSAVTHALAASTSAAILETLSAAGRSALARGRGW